MTVPPQKTRGESTRNITRQRVAQLVEQILDRMACFGLASTKSGLVVEQGDVARPLFGTRFLVRPTAARMGDRSEGGGEVAVR